MLDSWGVEFISTAGQKCMKEVNEFGDCISTNFCWIIYHLFILTIHLLTKGIIFMPLLRVILKQTNKQTMNTCHWLQTFQTFYSSSKHGDLRIEQTGVILLLATISIMWNVTWDDHAVVCCGNIEVQPFLIPCMPLEQTSLPVNKGVWTSFEAYKNVLYGKGNHKCFQHLQVSLT
jgi:hypothetical protein